MLGGAELLREAAHVEEVAERHAWRVGQDVGITG